jgi:hypothetical protein
MTEFTTDRRGILGLAGLAAGALRAPSGTSFALDLLARSASVRVNDDVAVVQTGGHTVPGRGAARYVRVAAAPTPEGLGRWWFRDASGSSFVLAEEQLTVTMFGALGDGRSDDWEAFRAAISYLQLRDGGRDSRPRYEARGPRLHVPAGHYFLSASIDLKNSVILSGDTPGLAGSGLTTMLEFAAGKNGIIIERHNTRDGSLVEAVSSGAADGTVLQNLAIVSRGGKAGHGVWAKARFVARDLSIAGFAGNGYNVVAASDRGGAELGNANSFQIWGGVVRNSGGSGIYVAGTDANAGLITGVDCTGNGGWGIWDGSFLGNTIIACHTSGNGLGQSGALVSHGGKRFAVAKGGAERAGSVEPGTDAKTWLPVGPGNPGPEAPAWSRGMQVRTGGAYRTDHPSSQTTLLGCYSEGGQGPSQLVYTTLVLGGLHGAGVVGTAVANTSFGQFASDGGFRSRRTAAGGAVLDVALNGNPDNGDVLEVFATGSPDIWRLRFQGGDLQWNHANVSVSFAITGPATSFHGGPHSFVVPRLFVGSGASARRQDTGRAPPGGGRWKQGDIVWNQAAAPGGHAGWICVSDGEPGKWSPFGQIA